jgi:hypothetical protein
MRSVASVVHRPTLRRRQVEALERLASSFDAWTTNHEKWVIWLTAKSR